MARLKSPRHNLSLTRCPLPGRGFPPPLFGTGGHRLARAQTDKHIDARVSSSPRGPFFNIVFLPFLPMWNDALAALPKAERRRTCDGSSPRRKAASERNSRSCSSRRRRSLIFLFTVHLPPSGASIRHPVGILPTRGHRQPRSCATLRFTK